MKWGEIMGIPRFIAFEGTECAGKTSAISWLKEYIEVNTGVKVNVWKAPGGTPVGQKLRSILLDFDREELDVQVQTYLFAADYVHLLRAEVLPALGRGEYVILDRYNMTSRVYQTSDLAITVANGVDQIAHPEMVFIMNVDYATMCARRDARNPEHNNANDYISEDRHNLLVGRYLKEAARIPDVANILDCHLSTEQVQMQIHKILKLRSR